MPDSLLLHLRSLIEEACERLPDVAVRRAFGSFGFYRDGSIFALAYARDGRVGVKLPELAAYAEAVSLAGAAPWAPHGSAMSHWVLLPETLHDAPDEVAAWVRRAHGFVAAAMPPPTTRKAAPRKRSQKPKPPARGPASKAKPSRRPRA